MDRYEKALEQARNYYPDNLFLDTIFPELAESEDEKIIDGFRTLLDGINRKGGLTLNKVPLQKCYAYLEKQKPAKWSEEDERIRQSLIMVLGNAKTDNEDVQKELDKQVAWLKSLSPQPHWKPSEEQMETLNRFSEDSPDLDSLYDDLKKL